MARRGMPVTCPDCGRRVAVNRNSQRLWRHGYTGSPCPGSGRWVDLYSRSVVTVEVPGVSS